MQPIVNLGAAPQRNSAVTAGTQTSYLDGDMNLGQDAGDVLWSANRVAVFHPS